MHPFGALDLHCTRPVTIVLLVAKKGYIKEHGYFGVDSISDSASGLISLFLFLLSFCCILSCLCCWYCILYTCFAHLLWEGPSDHVQTRWQGGWVLTVNLFISELERKTILVLYWETSVNFDVISSIDIWWYEIWET